MIKSFIHFLERKGIIDSPEERAAKKAAKRKKQEETLEYIFKVPISNFPKGWGKMNEAEAAEGGMVEVYRPEYWSREYGDIEEASYPLDKMYYAFDSCVASWTNKKRVVINFKGDFSYDKRIDLPFQFLKYAFYNGDWDIFSCGNYMENRLRPDKNSISWSYGDFMIEFFDEKDVHSGMRISFLTK